ncbi:MAG: alpha/beta hydrolase, partial [Acidobacteria bacterium]|nr:alpha/beta hydrolase [Acidobacteriota bacterium]
MPAFAAPRPQGAQTQKPAASADPTIDATAELHTFRLWEKSAPGALGDSDQDIPTLTLYPATHHDKPTAAIVVAPGGSYHRLAANHEGRQVANWFNAMGITAFVLQYRLGPRYHHPIELGDAQRAMRVVRSHAKEFNIDPIQLGFMGFSAGGHLASTLATHFDAGNASDSDPVDSQSCRPDFVILAYPVISMTADYSHKGSAENLLGSPPDPALAKQLSNELNVTPSSPPTFLFSTSADTLVPPENTVAFYLALRKAGVPAEMHIFEKGPHGVGLALNDVALSEWGILLTNWLRIRGV